MRICLLLLIICLTTLQVLLAVPGKGQSIQQVEITMGLNDESFFSAIKKIEQSTLFRFVYRNKDIRNIDNLNIPLARRTVEQTLSLILENTDQTFRQLDRNILIIKKKEDVDPNASFKTLFVDAIVAGRVTDNASQPLAGVSVKLKGTNLGVSTNADGNYSIKLPDATGTLIFTYVGYTTQEVAVNGRSEIDIQLSESATSLNTVMVVGYGTQKKANLTGAVDQVNAEIFQNRPTPSVSRALQGAIPNLNITMTDGKPTRGATYNIRGTTSINGGGALVLIDGAAGDPNLLNPNDIESVTVLKDASSAAIYGARAAFGVVLITTRKPSQDKIQVRYSANYSINKHTIRPEIVWDGYTWADHFNEAFQAYYDYNTVPVSVNNAFPFSLPYLDSLKLRHDDPSLPQVTVDPSTGRYVYYGSTDWHHELYKDFNPSTEHSLSISAGSKIVDYYLSGRFYHQDGVFRYNSDDFNRYNLRAKGNIQVAPWLTITNNTDFTSSKYRHPLASIYLDQGLKVIANQGFPMATMFNPDGTLSQNSAFTVGAFYQGNSHYDVVTTFFRNTTGFTMRFLDNQLKINGDFTYAYTGDNNDEQLYPVTYSLKPGELTSAGTNRLTKTRTNTSYYSANLYAELNKDMGDHSFKALVGSNIEYSSQRSQTAQRDGILNPDLPDFNLANGTNYSLMGGGLDWGVVGVFSRLNYMFKNKYLVEVNARYDGSSRFPSNQRFGFFPSASAGWRISQERFMESTRSWLDDLKLRVGYGRLGNGQIADYVFRETLLQGQSSVLLDGVYPSYSQRPNVLPNNLTWENSTTFNVGTDIGLLKNRFNVVFDWYNRKTTGMFTDLQPLPATFGAAVPKGNNADLSTKGWELSVSWRDYINFNKPLSYNIRIVLSDYVAEITKFNNPTGTLSSRYEGQRIGEIWGYTNEGYFTSMEDIASHANQDFIIISVANKRLPGDIKFADLNKDGKINNGKNTLADHGDLRIIGNTEPRYSYGINLGADWNSFSFQVFFQGIGKRDWWPSEEAGLFWGQYNRPYDYLPEFHIDNYWTPENPSQDAYFPRYRGYQAYTTANAMGVKQDKYLQDASYIRLKVLNLSYSLPKSLVSKIGMSSAKVYFSGQNLWTWSNMFRVQRNFDPEVIYGSDPEVRAGRGDGFSYPMLKTYSFGIDVTF